ncbi:glycosyltransferase family 2 protein [Ideonella sp.]|uniref:glycosyltransferase family 2 protein n=1 Tax=Ideonella sp. TaxID=1929293 RepID=UPI0035AF54D9
MARPPLLASLLGRSAADTAPAPAVAGPPTDHLHVERVEGAWVVGWSADAGGGSLPPRLHLDGVAVDARVEAVHREDVNRALQVPTGAPLGWRLQLPVSAWLDDGSVRHVEVRAGDRAEAVPLPRRAGDWLDAVRREGRVDLLGPLWEQLRAWTAPGQRVLDEAQAEWLADQSRRLHAALPAGVSPGQMAAPLGKVERLDRGVLQGWACWPAAIDEPLELWVDGQAIDAGAIRTERDDVARALGSPRGRLGFEFEVPAAVWAGHPDAVSLEVRCAGRPLEGSPLTWRRAQLADWLDAQRQAEAAVPAQEPAADRADRQYAVLLLLEHLRAAGLTDGAGALPAERLAFVREQAARFGVQLAAAAAPAPADELAAQGALADAAAQDVSTVTVWRLLRQFNARLLAGDTSAAALARLLDDPAAQGVVGQRCLWSLIPYFCAQGQFATVRPHLDAARLRRLAQSSSAWELSLVLPEAALAGDHALATAVMRRLADGAAGWVNTECVAAAVRTSLQPGDQGTVEAPVAEFLQAVLDHFEHLGRAPYWSRLHDQHLIGALVALLAHDSLLNDRLAYWAQDVAVRLYALVPDFWAAVDAVPAPAGGWGSACLEARQLHETVHDALHGGRDAHAALAALTRLRVLGNVDADACGRELAVEALAADPARAAALCATPEELIRLTAHPDAPALADWVHDPSALADRIARLADVPLPLGRRALPDLVAACMDGHGQALSPPQQAALRRMAGREGGYLGVRLAAEHWLAGAARRDPAQALAALVVWRDLWFHAFDDAAEQPLPPAPLSASYSRLDAAARGSGLSGELAAALGRVVAELRRALAGRHGDTVRELEAGARPVPAALADRPGSRSVLVAVYSCQRNLATRVQAIRDTWGRDLDARGIPWIVVVGDGDGQLGDDRVLRLQASDAYEDLPAKTLALVEWAWRHTPFEHLLKIDDDCHLAVDAYFAQSAFLAHHYHGRRLHRGIGGTDRTWHQGRSRRARAAASADKSPEPSTYADGGAGYVLSRLAMGQVVKALSTTRGARLTRSAFLEDKLLGDLLASRGITLASHGHYTLIRRRFGQGDVDGAAGAATTRALPVNAYDNLFLPGPASPTLVTHLDGHEDMAEVQAGQRLVRLRPHRLWPSCAPVRLGGEGTNQLELLSPPERARALRHAPVVVVAVARNERVLMPHFLAHYRQLGVRAFGIVDNLSDDGTREYLAAQDDVVLYSADTEYRHSHYGVSWQQALLSGHRLGRWAILADIDEFLVYPDCETRPVDDWLAGLDAAGHDAAQVLMVDMYPSGMLDEADFRRATPFEAAPCHDEQALLPWALGSGAYSNGRTYLSGLRHRLIPDSAPNLYTSQKIAVFRYRPWVRLSEGLHYASNLRPAPEPVWFAHFKYHAGFRTKVLTEVARQQHFNGAEEYRKYAALLAEARGSLADPRITRTWHGSRTWTRDA